MAREPCKYIPVCEQFSHVTGICYIPNISDKCEYRPDRVIEKLTSQSKNQSESNETNSSAISSAV